MAKEYNEPIMSFDTSAQTSYDGDAPQKTSDPPEPCHNNLPGSVGTDLTDTMMTTVVSNGSDALNLLFEAAQSDENGKNSARVGFSTNQVSTRVLASPKSPALRASTGSLPELSAESRDTCNAYRFVRMGWLSAEEVVWLLDR
jgi:hypothetical protein